MSRSTLPQERELMPLAPGFPPGESWLVLAPHPDDEVFGMGATIVEARRRAVSVELVIVTDGAAQGDPAAREAEALASAATLGLPRPHFWRFADRGLDSSRRALRVALRGAFQQMRPDTVFVTSPVELHPDHRALALAVHREVRIGTMLGVRRRHPKWLAAYEVATPIQPNLLVTADAAWDVKTAAGRCYAGQMAYRPYDRVMEALGVLRSLTLDGVAHAEAFYVLPAGDASRRSARAWTGLMGSTRGLDTA